MRDPVMTLDPSAVVHEMLHTAEGRADPRARYQVLHQRAPAFTAGPGTFVVCRYADCRAVLRDRRFGPGSDTGTLDAADDARRRGLVSQALATRPAAVIEDHADRIVGELTDDFGGEAIDVVAALAVPLPVRVIGQLLGVPTRHRPPFQELLRLASAPPGPAATAAADRMRAYFSDLVAERRRRPQDDLVTALTTVSHRGDRLADDEIVSTAVLLLTAGCQASADLIGNGLLALLHHPDQLRRLRLRPRLGAPAVEELLRWDAPAPVATRTARRDVTLAGHHVPAGTEVLALLGAANHDPTRFTDPARLDLARDQGPSLSFGAGMHHCPGAGLARTQARLALGRLLARYDRIELAGPPPVHHDSPTRRGLVELVVSFG